MSKILSASANFRSRSLRWPAIAVAAGLLLPVADAAALLGDDLELYVSEALSHDSNIFRVSSSSPSTVIGSSEKGDNIRTTTAGFNANVPVSLQRFQAAMAWNDTRYSRFRELDFTGHDGRAAWLWQVSDVLSGELGYSSNRTLASFINFDPTQPRIADPVDTGQSFANASFMVTPRWRLHAGVTSLEQRHGNVTRKDNDLHLQTNEVIVSYLRPDGNQLGISVRDEDARYPHRQVLGSSLFDNAYTQRSVGAVADWTPSGKSHVNARVDRVRRSFRQLGQRDFEGTTAQLAYDWKVTGKTTLTAVALRDISADEDIATSFVLVKGLALRPSVELREKLKLSGALEYSTREYLGNPGFVFGAPNHTDHVRLGSATLSYQPLRKLSLLLTLQREERTSNIRFGDYTDNLVNLGARYAF